MTLSSAEILSRDVSIVPECPLWFNHSDDAVCFLADFVPRFETWSPTDEEVYPSGLKNVNPQYTET